MSENLSILDGELRRQFAPVDRLSVDNQGGGVSPWVISDFLDISTLSVSENGLYLAAEDDCDAYEEVEVSAELEEGDYRKITGKDPNLDPNNDYAVGLDENGNLTKEMIPAAIHIVVPPRKRKYAEGETLDFTGIHVYLMDGNNKRYTDAQYPTGEIPFEELIFPVTIAEAAGKCAPTGSDLHPIVDTVATSSSPASGISDLWSGMYVKIDISYTSDVGAIYVLQDGQTYTTADDFILDAPCLIVAISASKTNSDYGINAPWKWYNEDGSYAGESGSEHIYKSSKTYNGKTAYFASIPLYSAWYDRASGGIYRHVESINDIEPSNVQDTAWIMLYGKTTNGSIPVQWMRSDGEILEDTFEIEVGESGEPSPPQPDPWAGYADVSWGGHHYNLNRRIVPEVHYANGYLWQEGISTEYNVEQAASMGWLILIR